MGKHSSLEAFRGFIGITYSGLTAQGISGGKNRQAKWEKICGGKTERTSG